MLPRITFDLGDLWQDLKEMVQDTYTLWTVPKEAPPTIRNGIQIGFRPLYDKNGKIVGCFSTDIVELALVNGLIAQEAEAKWQAAHPRATLRTKQKQAFYHELYNEDGSRKTAFELGNLPVVYSDYDQESYRPIQERVEREFANRIAQGKPLPVTEYKYLIKSDYLRDLDKIGLRAGAPRGITLNLLNPADKTTGMERAFHYLAQRSAMILTLIAALTVTGATTPAWFVVAALGVVLAEWCGKDFGTYGTAELYLRDLTSIFSKDFRWGDKISLKKTLKTAVLLAALGFATYGAAAIGWTSIVNLPWWNVAGASPLVANLITAGQYALSGFISGLGALMTFAGGKDAINFFWGLGIWDKHIDFSKEKTPRALEPEQISIAQLNEMEHKCEHALGLSPQAANQEYREEIHQHFTQLRDLLRNAHVAPQQEEQAPRARRRVGRGH